ncbi:FIST signal transduction protein [Cognataquiflexum aquatile]|uniref:FIST signal transduction protein n=1 Tax=Cognataquiflexum aquatile TaxID=2249427 RepID=UPI000DEB3029|nr:FIST N-terminal domain-containing protein [Cognataquiflexum aquatile]
MKAKSIKGNSTAEIKIGLEKSMEDGFRPTLAIVFVSIKQEIDAICNLLDLQDIKIFGATSCGEFIDGEIGSGTIAILLLDMDPSNFMILLEDYREKDPEVVAEEMAKKAKEHFKNPSFIISSSIDVLNSSIIGEPMLRAIEAVTGKDVVIWGGRAGDDFIFDETVVFTNGISTKRGIILLALNGDKILVKGQSASGLIQVGTVKTVTKVVGDWMMEIDNQPAADIVLKYLGLNLTQAEAESYNPGIIVFSLLRDQGEPVMRSTGVFNWKEKSILISSGIKAGDKIRFTLPPDFEIIEEVSRNAEKIKKKEMPEADALLMFSCAGRLGLLGPMMGEEIDGIREVFKVPMAGFFAYGEFGRTDNGNNEFHNHTCCWVALKEK